MRVFLRLPYALWCAAVFVAVALTALIVGLPAPRVLLRRGIARAAARTFFALSGIRLVVIGLDRLPPG